MTIRWISTINLPGVYIFQVFHLDVGGGGGKMFCDFFNRRKSGKIGANGIKKTFSED